MEVAQLFSFTPYSKGLKGIFHLSLTICRILEDGVFIFKGFLGFKKVNADQRKRWSNLEKAKDLTPLAFAYVSASLTPTSL